MKKTIILAAATALMLFTACEGKMDTPSVSEEQKITLDVAIIPSGQATKATGTVTTSASDNDTEGESKVNNLQIFVFSGDVRDGYISKDNATSAQVECTSGTRDIYCLVNAPASLSSVISKATLLATVSKLANTASSFEMIGSKTSESVTNNKQISISVNRIAAKIVVKSIENALRSGGAITIKRVFISNVAGQINYGLNTYAPANGTWFNKGGYRSSGNLGAYYFYAYPNNYGQANYNSTWAPKRTMLVVQIQYNDKLYDYPVDLGVALESNKMYVINNLKLVNLGNADDGSEGGSDEENPVTGVTAQVSVSVQDWTVITLGTSGEITI